MSHLIEGLKKEHETLQVHLAGIREASVVKPEGQKMLMDIREELMAHFKKEDELLYPFLNEETKKDESLRNTLDNLAGELAEVTHLFNDFFKRYSGNSSEIPILSYVSDYTILIGSFSKRVKMEEEVLFKEYMAREKTGAASIVAGSN